MGLREFWVGDMVLRKTLGSIVDPIYGKLGQNWEVPYIVTGAT